MEDRYIELKELIKKDAKDTPDIELGVIKCEKSGSFMQESNKNVQAVRLCLGTVEDSNRKILELRDRMSRITTEQDDKNIRDRLNKSMELNKNLFNKAKGLIDEMMASLEKLEKEAPDEPETRNTGMQCRALSGKFKDLLLESQEVQNEIRTKLKEKIVRQVKVLDTDMTQQEAEEVAEDANAFQELLMKKTLGHAHLRLRHAVEDIEEKYREIQNLEKHIMQLLAEIGILVKAQGDQLDTIEEEINKAQNYVERAEKHLVKAKKQHIRNRKKMCCIVICLALIGACIAVAIVMGIK